jgi:hypothetical protein
LATRLPTEPSIAIEPAIATAILSGRLGVNPRWSGLHCWWRHPRVAGCGFEKIVEAAEAEQTVRGRRWVAQGRRLALSLAVSVLLTVVVNVLLRLAA